MTNETPDRVWIDHNNPDNQYDCDEVHITPNMVEYIRKDAACVEVKEGYSVVNTMTKTTARPSEALTIRTVEDVRRDALGGWGSIEAAKRVAYRAGYYQAECGLPEPDDISAPSLQDRLQKAHDEHCEVLTKQAQPTPSPEPVAYMGVWPDGRTAWVYQNFPKYPHPDLKIVALYPTPPEAAALQADELRKAREDAWDEGYQWAYDGMSQRNPYRRSTAEGGE